MKDEDLGVYVVTLNEENLITPCLLPIMKVFPWVKVVDLGSQDSTISQLEKLGIPFEIKHTTREEYSTFKNNIVKDHEWALILDGDEIFPIECLTRLKEMYYSGRYKAYRINWRAMVYKEGKILASPPVINGTKLFKPGRLKFVGEWPWEVQDGKHRREEPKIYNGVWCWHGKLLNRTSLQEDLFRKLKREEYPYIIKNNHKVGWEELNSWPWEDPDPRLNIDLWEGRWDELETSSPEKIYANLR